MMHKIDFTPMTNPAIKSSSPSTLTGTLPQFLRISE
jgi:hypothetical protein